MRRQVLCVLVLLVAPAMLAAASVGSADAPVADAAMRGDVETLRRLLRGGADVNLPQSDGMTALHWALGFASPDAVIDCVMVWDVTPIVVGADQFFFRKSGHPAQSGVDI